MYKSPLRHSQKHPYPLLKSLLHKRMMDYKISKKFYRLICTELLFPLLFQSTKKLFPKMPRLYFWPSCYITCSPYSFFYSREKKSKDIIKHKEMKKNVLADHYVRMFLAWREALRTGKKGKSSSNKGRTRVDEMIKSCSVRSFTEKDAVTTLFEMTLPVRLGRNNPQKIFRI